MWFLKSVIVAGNNATKYIFLKSWKTMRQAEYCNLLMQGVYELTLLITFLKR